MKQRLNQGRVTLPGIPQRSLGETTRVWRGIEAFPVVAFAGVRDPG